MTHSFRHFMPRVFQLLMLLMPLAASAQPPELATVQGRLSDTSAGQYAMQFSLWNSQTGDDASKRLWSEPPSSAEIGANGMFQTTPGSVNPLRASNLRTNSAWLETSVSGARLQPRRRVGSVPFAMMAAESELLGGLQPDAYATPSQQEVNVRNYGAKGDGVADDSSAILAAISAVILTKGGTVWFPPGRYKIGQTIPINFNNISLAGAGRNSSVLVSDGNTTDLIRIGGWRSNIEHLGFEGGASAVNITGGAIHKIFDCRIAGSQTGIVIANPGSDTIQHQISYVDMEGIAGIAISLHHCGEVYLNNITIHDLPDTAYGLVCDTLITAFYSERIWISGGRPVTVRDTFTPRRIPEWLYFYNVHAENGAGYGWSFQAGHGYGLVACSATKTRGGSGVVISRYVNGETVLDGCDISENDQHGICLDAFSSTAFCRVQKCAIANNSRASSAGNYSGIYVGRYTNQFLLKGNGIWNKPGPGASEQKNGIHIEVGCSNFIVSENICAPHRADGQGILNQSGTSASKLVQNNIE